MRRVQTIPIETIRKDTLYINKEKYDSIYILQDKYTDRSKDTLFIKETIIEYRYKLLKDTVRIVQRDSIPNEVRITEVKKVRYIPPWCKWLSVTGAIALLLLVIKLSQKLKAFI